MGFLVSRFGAAELFTCSTTMACTIGA